MIEATILHELCHWGAEFQMDLPIPKKHERGEDFEMQAYGRIIPRRWHACPAT